MFKKEQEYNKLMKLCRRLEKSFKPNRELISRLKENILAVSNAKEVTTRAGYYVLRDGAKYNDITAELSVEVEKNISFWKKKIDNMK